MEEIFVFGLVFFHKFIKSQSIRLCFGVVTLVSEKSEKLSPIAVKLFIGQKNFCPFTPAVRGELSITGTENCFCSFLNTHFSVLNKG